MSPRPSVQPPAPRSSTQTVPPVGRIPEHVAIIMDGNGRWATRRHLPRTAGHAKGVQAVRRVVEFCGQQGVRYLTLFAFSSENWRRPADEVSLLMRLFVQALQREVKRLDEQGVRLRVVGDLSAFDPKLRALIDAAQERTARNNTLHLTIAANYGGRWDILQAMRRLLAAQPDLACHPEQLDEAALDPYLAMHWAPEPDLFIRTGGEQRISNFLIWQLAYTELYFTEAYWPDITATHMQTAFDWYAARERRFGRTSAQVADTLSPGPRPTSPLPPGGRGAKGASPLPPLSGRWTTPSPPAPLPPGGKGEQTAKIQAARCCPLSRGAGEGSDCGSAKGVPSPTGGRGCPKGG